MKYLNKLLSSHKQVSLFCILVTAVLYGCGLPINTGRDYDSKLISQLVLNKTTKAEAERLFGKPEKIDSVQIDNTSHTVFIYRYWNDHFLWFWEVENPPALLGRLLKVEFKLDTLTGYSFMSSMESDRTTFDYENIDHILENKTIEDDITKLMGPPHGRILLPSSMVDQSIHGIESVKEIWSYRMFGPEEKRFDQSIISLDVYFNSEGIVVKKVGRHTKVSQPKS
jgi:hypothetical protein